MPDEPVLPAEENQAPELLAPTESPASPPQLHSVQADNHDPIHLSEVIAELRHELEQTRTRATTAEQAVQQARESIVHEIGRSLGLVTEQDADPDQVIAELGDRATTADRRLRDYQIKDAITAAADTHHGDRKLLLPYLRGAGALDELDTDATDFTARIDSLVADAITANPKLASTPAVERSGGDFSAGTSSPPVPDDEDIESLRRKVRDSIASSRT